MNIDSVMDVKIEAGTKHVSQFEPSIHKYRPDWDPTDLAKLKAELQKAQPKKDGHYVEPFRYATGFNQEQPRSWKRCSYSDEASTVYELRL